MVKKAVNAFFVFLSMGIVLVNFLRLYIVVSGYKMIGRMPTFQDGFECPKAVLFTWKIDEYILLSGAFLLPLIFFVLLVSFIVARYKNRFWILIFTVFILFETAIRISDAGGYIMFD